MLEFRKDKVFGNVLYYPTNQKAHAITAIAKQITLTDHQIDMLKASNFEIKIT